MKTTTESEIKSFWGNKPIGKHTTVVENGKTLLNKKVYFNQNKPNQPNKPNK